jgi:Domain of unknown function (DUF1906)
MISTPITPGEWLDTDVPILAAIIPAILARKSVGVVRYLPLPANFTGNDASAGELERLTDASLGVMLVQHVRGLREHNYLWSPATEDGAKDAEYAVTWAERCEYPMGATIWQDLEGIDSTVGTAQTVFYCQKWADTVIQLGYQAGLYVGFSVPLSPGQLYALPHTTYWRAAGFVPSVERRGYSGQQGNTLVIEGTQFDRNTFSPDFMGDLPHGAVSGVPAAA